MIFYIIFTLFIIGSLILNIKECKNNKTFINIKVIKGLIITFLVFRIFYNFLPDKFNCYELYDPSIENKTLIIFRTFNDLFFILFPISFFFNSKKMDFLIYLMIPFFVGSVLLYTRMVPIFQDGFGIGSFEYGSHLKIWEFLTSDLFAYSLYSIYLILEGFLIVWFAVHKIDSLKGINIKFIFTSLGILVLLLLSFFPLAGPIYFFGNLPHNIPDYVLIICWILLIIIEVLILTKVLKNKSEQTKYEVLIILSLSLLFMYSQMFNIIECIRARFWPVQLCNIAGPLILIMLLKKSKKLYNYILITSCFGAFLAIVTLNVSDMGFFYPWNLHYLFEHQNIIVIPLLMFNLRIMPRLNKKSLKDAIKIFTIYFIFVLIFGWITEAVYIKSGNIFWWTNTFFIFKKEQALEFIPSLGILFDYSIQITPYWTIRLIQLIGYVFFLVALPTVYLILYLCESKRRKIETTTTIKKVPID